MLPHTGRVSLLWAHQLGRSTPPGRAGTEPPPLSTAWSDQRLQSITFNLIS